ncbi:hypothetical protein [uncultured Meiothermus sp.]|jgi:hypothetical protein|uniref:hypothetical protein n=1 Tax=uncultured Meiothermus sp. TaxID=157471 RepID=UPI00260BA8C3|nr:hypothetical protein [uncultured Meiothermus sp.]
MPELTPVGILSLVALAFGLLAGGQVVGGGFALSAEFVAQRSPALYLTPITIIRISDGPLHQRWWGYGVTLGGTVVYFDPHHPWLTDQQEQELRTAMELYELGHVEGWNHYGLTYLLKVFAEPCRYDPRAPWAGHCDRQRPPLLLAPHTGALRWVLP